MAIKTKKGNSLQGSYKINENSTVIFHKGQKIRIVMTPIPWSMVIIMSFVNAILIIFAKALWIAFFGEPKILTAEPEQLRSKEIIRVE